LDAGKPAPLKMSASTVSLTYCVRVNMRSHSDEAGKVMAGKHRAKAARRQTDAYAWLGTGAVTLALGAALAGGVGVAHADTTSSTGSGPRVSPPGKSAATTSIRTTVSAQSVSTSTHSSKPKPKPAGDEKGATSVVSTKNSVVRDQNPAVTGDNNPGPGPTLAETVIGLNNGDVGAIAGIPGLEAVKNIPFIDLGGGGGGGLLSKIAGALSGGMF
jgi:hypothetical protein